MSFSIFRNMLSYWIHFIHLNISLLGIELVFYFKNNSK